MKLYVAFVLLLVGTALAQDTVDGDQPDCTRNLQQRIKYRNKDDPTSYWVCGEPGQPPVLEKCPEGTEFNFGRQSCGNENILPETLPEILSNRMRRN